MKIVSIVIVVIVAIVISWLLLDINKNTTQYYEYTWQPRIIVDTVFSQEKAKLTLDDSIKYSFKHYANKKTKRVHRHVFSRGLKKELVKLNAALLRYTLLNDTLFERTYFNKHVWIKTAQYDDDSLIANKTSDLGKRKFKSIPIIIIDSNLPNRRIDGWYNAELKVQANRKQFYLTNPDFGLWYVLLLTQVGFSVLCIALLIYYIFFKPLSYQPRNSKWHRWQPLLLLIVAMTFCLIYFKIFIFLDDSEFIPLNWIQVDSTSIFSDVAYIGYFAGALSLTGFLLCVQQVNTLKKELDNLQVKIFLLQETYREIRHNLKIYFMTVVTQFALCVSTSTALIYAINNLPLVRSFARSRGKELISYKVMLAYGFLHIFVVLSFYLITRQIVKSVPQKHKIIVDKVNN